MTYEGKVYILGSILVVIGCLISLGIGIAFISAGLFAIVFAFHNTYGSHINIKKSK